VHTRTLPNCLECGLKLLRYLLLTLLACLPAQAQPPVRSGVSPGIATEAVLPTAPEMVIIDTDIGDDIDDAFAVGLALRSPELEVIGITTTFGDTEARAKLVDRMLGEVGRQDIPVAVGTPSRTTNVLTQHQYAQGGHFARASHPAAVNFIAEQILRHPGQITLIAIGPLMNVGALIDQQPDTFRKLKRVVLMGGSIYRGYADFDYLPARGSQPEWNILNDIPSARKLFASEVPLYVMPLDSTQVQLDEVKRSALFRLGTPLTDQLTLLYHEWGQQTPTLYDVITVAYVLSPATCPVQPMHIVVDDKGRTLVVPGTPNAQVCLHADTESFFRLLMSRIGAPDQGATIFDGRKRSIRDEKLTSLSGRLDPIASEKCCSVTTRAVNPSVTRGPGTL
jgi:purine nucleosidase